MKHLLKVKVLMLALMVGLVSMANVAHALLSADATAIFTATDVAGISSSVSAVLVAFVGIGLVFLAYRYSKKAISRG